MLNGLQGGCADWPGNLSTLCVEGSCKPYVLQQNDTCLGISAANNITLIQLLSWNPSIDPVCSNLNQKIGHVICLSSPMGYTAPNQTDLGVGPTPATTAAPVPTSALNQTNKYCGAWYYVNPGDCKWMLFHFLFSVFLSGLDLLDRFVASNFIIVI